MASFIARCKRCRRQQYLTLVSTLLGNTEWLCGDCAQTERLDLPFDQHVADAYNARIARLRKAGYR